MSNLLKFYKQNKIKSAIPDRPTKPKKKPRTTKKSRGSSRQALQGHVREYDYIPQGQESLDPLYFLVKYMSDITSILESEIEEKKSIKWGLSLHVRYSKTGTDGVKAYTEPFFKNKMVTSTETHDTAYQYSQVSNELYRKMDNYEGDSSNLNFKNVIVLKLLITKFNPFNGSSYLPLPPELKRKCSILNIRNLEDDKCFLYSVLAH